jgi:hypothetical protein
VLLLALGTLMWWFERKRNQEQFGGGTEAGIGSSFWWSAVTMTTVGYGDKAPITFGGRVVAFLWMLIAIIIVSVFTATITSTLTVAHLDVPVKGPQDLPKGSSLRKPINVVLPAKIQGREWQDNLHRYMGSSFDLNAARRPQ